MIAGFPFIASSMDSNARSFVQASGATDRAAINYFVKGIKRLGLWGDMVCWPLRSAQNAGTGSTAYSLGGLGTFNGTLVNGPTWGGDGVAFVAASSQRISTSLVAQIRSLGSVYDATSNGSDLVLLSNRNATVWTNGLSLLAREGSDSQCLIDVAGTSARIRATRTPVFGQFVFSQATATDAGSSDALQTTYRQDKNSRSAGNYVVGTNEPMASSGTALTIAASGPTGGTQFFNGDMAFSFISTQFFSSSQQESFFDLYKSTLGQGLGLP